MVTKTRGTKGPLSTETYLRTFFLIIKKALFFLFMVKQETLSSLCRPMALCGSTGLVIDTHQRSCSEIKMEGYVVILVTQHHERQRTTVWLQITYLVIQVRHSWCSRALPDNHL